MRFELTKKGITAGASLNVKNEGRSVWFYFTHGGKAHRLFIDEVATRPVIYERHSSGAYALVAPIGDSRLCVSYLDVIIS